MDLYLGTDPDTGVQYLLTVYRPGLDQLGLSTSPPRTPTLQTRDRAGASWSTPVALGKLYAAVVPRDDLAAVVAPRDDATPTAAPVVGS